MIVSAHTTCDICGAVKGATNHWLVACQVQGMTGIVFVPAADATIDREFAGRTVVQDICGQACAIKRLSQFLETL